MEGGGNEVKLMRALQPTLVSSFFLGLTFPRKTLVANTKFVLFYRIVVFVGLIFSLLKEIPNIAYWNVTSEGTHSRMLVFIETRFRWFTVFAAFVLNAFNNSKLNDVLAILTGIPLTLRAVECRRLLLFQIFIFFTSLPLLVSYMCLGNEVLWRSPHHTWYTSIIYIVTEVYAVFANYQFIVFLTIVEKYFVAMNDNLESLNLKSTNCGKTWAISLGADRSYPGVNLLVGEIVRIRHIHMTLVDSSEKINECFNLHIILFMLLSTIEMTYALRSPIIFFFDPNGNISKFWRTKYWHETLLTIFWSSYYLWNILNIVVVCESVVEQTVKTKTIVTETINKVDAKQLKKQLQVFSLQLMNLEIYLSAGKCVLLKYSFIISILGTVGTYLVIIVTFRN